MRIQDGLEARFRQLTPLFLLAVVAAVVLEPWLPGGDWLRGRFGDTIVLRAAVAGLGLYVLLLWGESLRLHGILTGVLQAFRDFAGERTPAPPRNAQARQEAVRLLVAALRSEDPSIRATSRRNLVRLAGRDLGDDPAAWQGWLDRPGAEPGADGSRPPSADGGSA
ncbi:MAG: hypothetical protein KF830_05030 [Planctomycetes bacterium]|nr:hypothetical protein [Planctomycetota bacterium]